MRYLALLAIAPVGLLATVDADAQPITGPDQVDCAVHVIAAPPPVRVAIERWVSAEPRCARELEVRVDETNAGLHLVATDKTGRIRERVIPDAQSAAVLVVSWMADDSIAESVETSSVDEARPSDPAPPPSIEDDESPLSSGVLRRSAATNRAQWLTLGLSATNEGLGVHGQVDLLGRGHWTIGLGGGWRQSGARTPDRMDDSSGVGDASAFTAYTRSFGRIDARVQLGLGVDLATRADAMSPGSAALVPKLDAGAFIGVRLDDRWGLLGGPLLAAPLDGRSPSTLSGFVGLERRL
jgi:hypothetical protein